jgi:hypothetical protein
MIVNVTVEEDQNQRTLELRLVLKNIKGDETIVVSRLTLPGEFKRLVISVLAMEAAEELDI